MNILIAGDSFKDALTASEVCRAIAAGIRAGRPDANIRLCPLADGGEGTYEVLAAVLGLHAVDMPSLDPLFRPLNATYGRSADGQIAFVEMAKTAGLQLLTPGERNPLSTSSFGMGRQIAHAIHGGAQRIILAIGGSATNDAGIGMAAALGWAFFDLAGTALQPVGGNLSRIATIVPPPERPDVRVEVICDVTNPLFGLSGAAWVYARQKGADDAAIDHLDKGLRHFARVAAQHGSAPDPAFPGAGAAGGMGFGAMYFLQARLRRGIDAVLDLVDADEKLNWADLVVTGEGKIDFQTAHGKLIQGLCARAAGFGTPVIALCGRLEASAEEIEKIGLQAAYCINDPADPAELPQQLKNTAANLERTSQRIFESFQS